MSKQEDGLSLLREFKSGAARRFADILEHLPTGDDFLFCETIRTAVAYGADPNKLADRLGIAAPTVLAWVNGHAPQESVREAVLFHLQVLLRRIGSEFADEELPEKYTPSVAYRYGGAAVLPFPSKK